VIIFGTRGVNLTKERGTFNCPECESPRPFKHVRARRFFTLYFIPVIPLDLLGEFIECQDCRSTYHTKVLDYDPGAGSAKLEAEFHKATRQAMIHMMLADGQIDDEEIGQIRKLYKQVAGVELGESEIRAEIREVEGQAQRMLDRLRELGGNLNEHGKELVIKAALLVAAADGEFQKEEQELLNQIAEAIRMSPAHLRGVMSTVLDDTH